MKTHSFDLFTAMSIEQTSVHGVATRVETFVEAAASPAVRQRDVTTRVDEEATLADLKRQTFVPSEVKRNREFPLPGNWTSFKCWGGDHSFFFALEGLRSFTTLASPWPPFSYSYSCLIQRKLFLSLQMETVAKM